MKSIEFSTKSFTKYAKRKNHFSKERTMSKVEELHALLSNKMDEIKEICDGYNYEINPTLLLRHDQGPSLSIVLSNDDLNKAILCIAELGNIGEVIEDESQTEL